MEILMFTQKYTNAREHPQTHKHTHTHQTGKAMNQQHAINPYVQAQADALSLSLSFYLSISLSLYHPFFSLSHTHRQKNKCKPKISDTKTHTRSHRHAHTQTQVCTHEHIYSRIHTKLSLLKRNNAVRVQHHQLCWVIKHPPSQTFTIICQHHQSALQT